MGDEYEPLTEHGREGVQSIVDALTEVGESIGGYRTQVNARENGTTVSYKFEKRPGVYVALQFAEQLANCPALLVDACRKLLRADAALAERTEAAR